MSVVLLFRLKPHWLSGVLSSAMVGTSLLSSILARIFPAMESRVIPGSCHSLTFPLCSCTG